MIVVFGSLLYCSKCPKKNHKTKLVFIEIGFWYGYGAEGMAAVSNHGYEGMAINMVNGLDYFMADLVNCY